MSVPVNTAKGPGKTGRAERNNRNVIARGEVMECGAIIDGVKLIGVMPPGDLADAKHLLVRTVEMLSKLCR